MRVRRHLGLMAACAPLWLAATAFAAPVGAATACGSAEDGVCQQPGDIVPLDRALEMLALDAGVQIVFEPGDVGGLSSPEAKEGLPPGEALRELLDGTSLTAREIAPGAWLVSPAARASDAVDRLDEVVVTGTLIRGSADPSVPLVRLDREALDVRGQGSIAEAVQSLPQTFGGAATPVSWLSSTEVGGTNSTLATGVSLRGLGADATLVLVDGRRVTGSGSRGEFGDLSAIPAAAVDRIDILLDGASALYGSDAVGGVVNVVMKRDYAGAETRLRAGAAEGGAEDVLISHLAGVAWATGSAFVGVEHRRQGSLNASDRAYTATGDLRPYGGSDWRTPIASPGTIVRFDPVVGGFVGLWAIRPGQDGQADSPAEFEPGANLDHRRRDVDLIPDQTRSGVFARVRQSLSERVEISGDLRLSRRRFGLDGFHHGAFLTVTRANPFFYSPSGAANHLVAYSFVEDLAQPRVTGFADSAAATLGGRIELPAEWRLQAYGAFAVERSGLGTPQLNSSFVNEALGTIPDNPQTTFSASRDGFLNPFGSGGTMSQAVLEFIDSGFIRSRFQSRLSSADLIAEGPGMQLPGGRLRMALGLHWRREGFSAGGVTFTSGLSPLATQIPDQSREIGAVFAEARAPLVSEQNARPGLRRLEVSVAARAERYDDFGSTVDPRFGVVWSPVEPLLLRASFGTSFRAPSLTELNEAVQIGATVTRENGAARLAVITLGGNPDLGPETAETRTIGADWRGPHGLRLSATRFEVDFQNRIARPVAENLLNVLSDASLSPFVRRVDSSNPADLALIESLIADPRFSPAGLYPATAFSAILDGRWLNTGALKVRGWDLSASVSQTLGFGIVSADVAAAVIDDYERKITPLATGVSLDGVTGYPANLRLTAGMGVDLGPWRLRGSVDRVSGARDLREREVDAWTTASVFAAWTPARGPLFGTELQLQLSNIFDAAPPFVDQSSGYGFDAANADPLGRRVSVQLVRKW